MIQNTSSVANDMDAHNMISNAEVLDRHADRQLLDLGVPPSQSHTI